MNCIVKYEPGGVSLQHITIITVLVVCEMKFLLSILWVFICSRIYLEFVWICVFYFTTIFIEPVFSKTKLLVHSLVTSRLDYANGLLHNAPISVIKKLDRVQRSSDRVVCRLHKYQRISMTEVLHDLYWLPVASRIKYKLLIVTFKALRTDTPGYLSDLLMKQSIIRRTRSQSSDAPDRHIVPLYSGERSAGTSYSVAAPNLCLIFVVIRGIFDF